MKVRTENVRTETFIAEDGQEFKTKEACLKHEAWCRGRAIVQRIEILDETRYYFKADTVENWKDCLTYLEDRLYTDFLRYNEFELFAGKWVFTGYDVQGEFYKLRTGTDLMLQLAAAQKEILAQIDFIANCI